MFGYVVMGVIFLYAAVFFVAIRNISYRKQKRLWNNGVAPCGSRWKPFDSDNLGGHGYKCGGRKAGCTSGHYLWIDYESIDRRD